jgi:hypothetical protein
MGMFDEVLDNVGEPYSGGGKGFEYGTHEVLIGTVEAKSKDTKKATDCAIIEVVVFDEKMKTELLPVRYGFILKARPKCPLLRC